MRKFIGLVLLVACVFGLTSCTQKENNPSFDSTPSTSATTGAKQVLSHKYSVDENGNVMNFFDTLDTLHKSGENYQIYTDGFSFRYTVTDNNGKVLDIGYHDYRGSFDLDYQGKLLVLEYGSGGNVGIIGVSKRYYDVEAGRVSPFFAGVLAHGGTKVVYFAYREQEKKTVLIVQDLFDPADCYEEFERDFANSPNLLYNDTKAEFLNDGKQLQITYPAGVQEKDKPVEYKTEVLSLS